jgi:hypothetical protein
VPPGSAVRSGSSRDAPAGPPGARDDIEERLSKIWARILRIDHALVGPDSDFHALGGDSLSMLEMLAAVAAELPGASTRDALAMPVIHNPTLAAVSTAIRKGTNVTGLNLDVPRHESPVTGPLDGLRGD